MCLVDELAIIRITPLILAREVRNARPRFGFECIHTEKSSSSYIQLGRQSTYCVGNIYFKI